MIPIDKLLEVTKFAIKKGFKVSIKNECEAKFEAKRVFVNYNDDDVTVTVHSCEDVTVNFFELDTATFKDAAGIARMLWDNREFVEE